MNFMQQRYRLWAYSGRNITASLLRKYF